MIIEGHLDKVLPVSGKTILLPVSGGGPLNKVVGGLCGGEVVLQTRQWVGYMEVKWTSKQGSGWVMWR